MQGELQGERPPEGGRLAVSEGGAGGLRGRGKGDEKNQIHIQDRLVGFEIVAGNFSPANLGNILFLQNKAS